MKTIQLVLSSRGASYKLFSDEYFYIIIIKILMFWEHIEIPFDEINIFRHEE